MFCNNCGKIAENGSAFCTNCGVRLEARPIATKAEQTAAIAEAQPVQENEEKAAEASFTHSVNTGIYEKQEPVMPYAPENIEYTGEKVDFGKGALAFCLVIIGLLAISTGVFAGLYFSVV